MYKLLHRLGFVIAIFAGWLCVPVSSEAHPVAYQDSIAIMGWNSPMMSDYWVSYGLTSRFAATARYFSLRPVDVSRPTVREFYFPQFNFLLKRWNELDSQANIYLSASYGLEKEKSVASGAASAAVETDWESRRYYVSGKYQVIRLSRNEPIDYARFRVGIAPYLADYKELQSWFMVQVERQPEYFQTIQVTPMVRCFYRNVLWELGASTTGNWMLNFMVHL